MALHHTQTVFGEKRIAFRIYHPWRMTRAPLRHRLCHFSAARRSPYDPPTLSLTLVVHIVTNGIWRPIFSKSVSLTEQEVSLVCSYRNLSLQYNPAVSPNVSTFPQPYAIVPPRNTLFLLAVVASGWWNCVASSSGVVMT